MKIEINIENKAKFFSMYFGQNILENPFGQTLVNGRSIDYVFTDSMDAHLNLKSLSHISDEDAIKVAKIMYPKDNPTDKACLEWGKEIAKEIIQGQIDKDIIWFSGILYTIDYLRSIGYALPWMGLSVEELIEAYWIKLT